MRGGPQPTPQKHTNIDRLGPSAPQLVSLFWDVPDNWNFNASNPCLHVGGNYNQNLNHGLFYVNYNTVSNSNANIGCRLLRMVCNYGPGKGPDHDMAQKAAHPLVKIWPSGHVLVPPRGRGKAHEA